MFRRQNGKKKKEFNKEGTAMKETCKGFLNAAFERLKVDRGSAKSRILADSRSSPVRVGSFCNRILMYDIEYV
jgi:hypothetical protein